MKKHHGHHILRRTLALTAAVATLCAVGRTADLGAALRSLHTGSALAENLLRLELEDSSADDDLNGWTRLLALETPTLAEVSDLTDSKPETSADAIEPEAVETPADAEPEAETAEEDDPSEPDPEEDTAPDEPIALDLSSISGGDIDVDNHTASIQVDPAKCWKQGIPLTLQSADKGPQILIMHTHTTEAYTMDGNDIYEESDPARTTDENYNMIRVGEEMKTVFEALGLSVIHDTTAYDYPGYNGSYGRSLTGTQSYLDQYPTIQVVLDVHRDALIASDGTVYSKTTTIDGEKVAQVMLVVGTNDGGLDHPDWKNHFALAVHLQGAMLALDSTLPRSIDLRSQRFNQHLTPGSLLVEVGTSGNTLQEALAGARLFAQSAGQIYLDCIE